MSSEGVRYTPHYSIDDYRQWEGDWELWDGIPVCMSPSPTARHQLVSMNLASMLTSAVAEKSDCNCLVIHETDWHINESTVVRPDIVVLCHGLPEQFIDYPPSVIVEVLSPSTADKDRTAKKELYRRHGVHFYLMADPDKRTVEVHHLVGGAYVAVDPDDDQFCIRWNETCSATIRTADVFRD